MIEKAGAVNHGTGTCSRPSAGGDALRRRTAMLVRSRHLGWNELRSLVEEEGHLTVVADVASASRAVEAARRLQPAVLLVGDELPDADVGSLTRELRTTSPASKIVVIANEATALVLVALARTIDGFLLWCDLSGEVVPACIATVEAGLRVGSQGTAEEIAAPHRPMRLARKAAQLTHRERAVLQGLARGQSEREIAEAVGCALRTIEREIAQLEEDFDVHKLYDLRLVARELPME